MKASDYEKSFEDRPVRTSLKFSFIVIGVVSVLSVAGWAVKMVLFPVQQVGRVLTKTFDADNMIYNYEWFKRQNQDIEAIGSKYALAIQTLKQFEGSAGPRDQWKFDDRQEWNRLNTIQLALLSQRAQMVGEYNARSQMANRDIFRTGYLPDQIQQ